jgi:hypothetical protein
VRTRREEKRKEERRKEEKRREEKRREEKKGEEKRREEERGEEKKREEKRREKWTIKGREERKGSRQKRKGKGKGKKDTVMETQVRRKEKVSSCTLVIKLYSSRRSQRAMDFIKFRLRVLPQLKLQSLIKFPHKAHTIGKRGVREIRFRIKMA